MAAYINDIRQGDTRVIQIDYGKGVDITGWKFYFLLRTEMDDSTNVLQIEVTAGGHADDDILNGLAHLTIPSTDTAGLEPGKYYYAIKVDKGGTPNVIKTLVPPIEDAKDKITVFDGIEIL
jgi:hypothetical protein